MKHLVEEYLLMKWSGVCFSAGPCIHGEYQLSLGWDRLPHIISVCGASVVFMETLHTGKIWEWKDFGYSEVTQLF